MLAALGCNPGSATGGSGGGSGGSTTSSTTSGAGGAGTGGSGAWQPSGFACSGKKPLLSSAVVPITTANCATTPACHTAMESGPGVFNMLVGIIAEECLDERLMIKPGDPEHSYVINKLTGRNLEACSPETTMPLGGALLPSADVQTIYDWICAGATND